jgi:predicted DNA-binding ribbon-helix-helix protein
MKWSRCLPTVRHNFVAKTPHTDSGRLTRVTNMKSSVIKRSIVVDGHKTSVSLEDAFWTGLKAIASERQETLSDLVRAIDGGRANANLSSAIRLFVLGRYRDPVSASEEDQVRRRSQEQGLLAHV